MYYSTSLNTSHSLVVDAYSAKADIDNWRMADQVPSSSAVTGRASWSGLFIVGEWLECIGGKYKGSIVTFVKKLNVKVRVKFNDGLTWDLREKSMGWYDPEVPVYVPIARLLSELGAVLQVQNTEAVDAETFLIICNRIARSAFEQRRVRDPQATSVSE